MNIRRAIEADIPRIVAIAEVKRVEYEGFSPVFWRKAPDSSPKQELFFQRLLTAADVIALVAETEASLLGFIIGAVTTAPPVYNPGGPVCIVDDFTVANPTEWDSIGAALLAAVEQEAKARGAVMSVVVCAQRDQAKRNLLREAGLTVASEWHVKPISSSHKSRGSD
ncbi:MAG TPA: GNAT family N-acetyltransferase [Candidatus Binatia bacterium]|nr:GNAT family N-acetyltransferase [Candidatus Binatia bacterium]